jgi:hypothetical protein
MSATVNVSAELYALKCGRAALIVCAAALTVDAICCGPFVGSR